jgi:transcription elongation factor GreA
MIDLIISRKNLLSIRLCQLTKRLYAMNSINMHSISKHSVGIGSVVTVRCEQTQSEMKIKVISSEISNDSISDFSEVTLNSPFGKALVNKSIDDAVVVYTPLGVKRYTILKLITIHDT